MTWKHTGKTEAFEHLALDSQSAQSYNISIDHSKYDASKLMFTKQSLAMLASMNDFDQRKVLLEVKHICKNPNAHSSTKHSRTPMKRLWRSRDQFRSYHYLIEYKTSASGGVIIHDIYFDRSLRGSQGKVQNERNMMYNVNRISELKFSGVREQQDLDGIKSSWLRGEPVTQIKTQHVAVNGMQNELNKASWLMGSHLDVAYPKDEFNEYTLFHNPTDKMLYDVVECLFDKRLGTKSQNAQHLAAVLYQRQNQGKRTKWVVHSQGAIIFCAALEEYKKRYNTPLTHHQVSIHAPGSYLPRFNNAASNTGIKLNQSRSNPFDLVPNMAGANDLSPSALVRSLKFLGVTFFGSELTSPHTLPYLGLESYHAQLKLAGKHQRAEDVLKYIEKHT